jgi:AcrR family transcriptional regulator
MSTQAKYGSGRERLLAAAGEVFAEKGYRGATTRDIAERAGITEPMLFRYFGSKVALFEEAAVEPVVRFIDEYVEEWTQRDHGRRDAEEEVRELLTRLHEVLSADRKMLVAILAAGEFDPALASGSTSVEQAFGRLLALLEQMLGEEIGIRGLHSPDRPALARMLVAVPLSLALQAEWLQASSVDAVVAESARVIVHGLQRDDRHHDDPAEEDDRR